MIELLDREKSILGPLFLLCTLALGAPHGVPLDLLLLTLTGLYLSARWQLRGCYYALALLGLVSAVKHAWFVTDHLWQLGIEGSLALAFFITALAFEQGALFIASLMQQMETRKSAVENLEEELSKARDAALSQQIVLQEKIATLQKELDDLQSEHSSILILNEVLRKTTARHRQEAETAATATLDHERQLVLLKAELDETEKELGRLSSTEALAIQNQELMNELNAARYEKEQTHLINETLARLYARETLKAKEANEEAGALADQLAAAHREVRRIEQPLKEQLNVTKNEVATLTSQFEKAVMDANEGRLALQKLTEVQTERNFLRERLQAATEELAHRQKGPHDAQELAHVREKALHLSQIEPLFHQLKKQFEEKAHVLHQTRSHLFAADTELQKLRMEKAALELNPLPKEVECELQDFGKQIEFLEEENIQLQELVTLLSGKMEPQLEKKK